jgi:hypothetical protein
MIKNNSKKVKVKKFKSWDEAEDWVTRNKITTAANIIYGYNKILYEVHVPLKSYDTYYVNYVLERFNGQKIMYSEDTLLKKYKEADEESTGIIVNLIPNMIDGFTITDKNKVNVREYLPNKFSINLFIYHTHQWGTFSRNNTTKVVKTSMTKQEFSNIETKLKLTGAEYMLVDLNTIGVKQGNCLLLYTRQKDIT